MKLKLEKIKKSNDMLWYISKEMNTALAPQLTHYGYPSLLFFPELVNDELVLRVDASLHDCNIRTDVISELRDYIITESKAKLNADFSESYPSVMEVVQDGYGDQYSSTDLVIHYAFSVINWNVWDKLKEIHAEELLEQRLKEKEAKKKARAKKKLTKEAREAEERQMYEKLKAKFEQ